MPVPENYMTFNLTSYYDINFPVKDLADLRS